MKSIRPLRWLDLGKLPSTGYEKSSSVKHFFCVHVKEKDLAHQLLTPIKLPYQGKHKNAGIRSSHELYSVGLYQASKLD